MRRRPGNFADILNQACRWPKQGDRLLRRPGDWDRGVKFPKDEISRHVFIWKGFMSAAATLIDASEGDRAERQILIFPILFNYRHAIELAMKWIIVMYSRGTGVEVGDTEHHDLWELWKICRQIINPSGENEEALKAVEQVIKDFHDLDKAGLKFRYSRDKRGALISLPDELIDLEHIRDVMEAVGNFFDGVDAQLSAY
jgi:hypothetical protein